MGYGVWRANHLRDTELCAANRLGKTSSGMEERARELKKKRISFGCIIYKRRSK
jgi:hypothetical protein